MDKPVRYRLIDCFKGISCLAVVLIHFNLPDEAGVVAKSMMTFAVPFFFFVSGFFMPDSRLMLHTRRTWKKIKHILNLVIWSALLYTVFTLVWYNLMYTNWDMDGFITKELTVPSLIKLFLSCDPFVYGHLWYLFALVFCYLVFLPFQQKKVSNWLLIVAVPLMAVFFILAEFRDQFGINVFIELLKADEYLCLPNMPLFRALPLFIFGMVLRRNEEKIRRLLAPIPGVVFITVMVLGCLVAVYERYHTEISQYYLGTQFTCYSMALYAISHPENSNKALEYIGAKLSLYVYIVHTAAGKFADYFAQKVFHLTGTAVYRWGRWLMAMLASLAAAWVIYQVVSRIQRKNKVPSSPA